MVETRVRGLAFSLCGEDWAVEFPAPYWTSLDGKDIQISRLGSSRTPDLRQWLGQPATAYPSNGG